METLHEPKLSGNRLGTILELRQFQITFADCCIVPQLLNANRNNVDMSKFPIINRISAELAKHEAFIKAHPDNQPDCKP